MEQNGENIKFEEALSALEAQVKLLENGKLSLEESLQVFERGVALSRICASQLDTAQKKVEKIVAEADGGFGLETFEE